MKTERQSFALYKQMLADGGLNVEDCRTTGDLVAIIQKTGFHRRTWDAPALYIRRYLGLPAAPDLHKGGKGQERRYEEYRPKPHWRLDDILAGAPERFVSMSGTGNGSEVNNGYARGR